MSSTAEKVKELRQKTGAGIMSCKKALKESNNNPAQALEWLKKNSLNQALKKTGRMAGEGLVASYIHGGGRIGVLLEVNSETDFVARNQEFQNFVKELSLHITAMNPLYLKEEDIPQKEAEKEKQIFAEQARLKNTDPKVRDRISDGLYKKWLKEVCLFHQEFVRQNQGDSQQKNETVKTALTQLSAKMGENIVIRRFVRYALGESETAPLKPRENLA